MSLILSKFFETTMAHEEIFSFNVAHKEIFSVNLARRLKKLPTPGIDVYCLIKLNYGLQNVNISLLFTYHQN